MTPRMSAHEMTSTPPANSRRRFLRGAALTVAATRFGIAGSALALTACDAAPFGFSGGLEALANATAWLNSPPLTAAGLRGKVVLVDFWTYTCINWLRSFPYVRGWAERYQNHGLVVIGAHTPEFPFEHDVDNVQRAAAALQVDYPIVVDSDAAIWNAFGNAYWPALYFVDAQGRVRGHQFGEGAYDQAERMLQTLLTEAGHGDVGRDLTTVDPRGSAAAADWADLQTPETYLGYDRAERFASPGGFAVDRSHTYAAPDRLGLNQWALAGDWTVGNWAAVLNDAGGRIAFRFHARDLHLVMGPAPSGAPVRFRVAVDGVPPGAAHGLDVDAQGNGAVAEPRLYQLIRQATPIADRSFEIAFLDPGVAAYDVTFG
jgi:thiol-disulfide isomerase/thioredoxin